ncbi:uncharacterized protein LOC116412708 [Galleria mellonella]|uniref:Uncharacterized protein LOC116412708 n=1 Tax=Galleria mellonella TaxID=7137 RepID=A0ABM3MTL4_GALME|nr:uncharacterized protein LOC116412708 [Galleria mellonella]
MALVKVHFVAYYCLLFGFAVVNGVPDITLDYYFGDALKMLRPQESCGNIVNQYLCYVQCGGHNACAFGKCFCVSPLLGNYHGENYHRYEIDKDANSDFDEYTETTTKAELFNELKRMDSAQYAPRSTLRHHIAHFCPNLDYARACIRTCMKAGKPAFCGKDHVCYCGHKSGKPRDATKVDVSDTYKEFRDMYEKYFGTKKGNAND